MIFLNLGFWVFVVAFCVFRFVRFGVLRVDVRVDLMLLSLFGGC